MTWAISNEIDLATQNAAAGTLAKQDLQGTPFLCRQPQLSSSPARFAFPWLGARFLNTLER